MHFTLRLIVTHQLISDTVFSLHEYHVVVFNYLKVFRTTERWTCYNASGYFLIADISGYTEFVKLHTLKQKPLFGKFMAKILKTTLQ